MNDTPANEKPMSDTFESYLVGITASAINIREEPDVYSKVIKTLIHEKSIYTIVEEADGPIDPSGSTGRWGKLKGGGWIALKYTEKR